MVTACHVLDRLIRAGRYWIPHWYKPSHWIAYWDVFARPPEGPRYALGAPDTWWYDGAKAAKLDQAARAALDPKGFTWIVVGDAAKVRPQLEKLGMPIEQVDAP